AWLPQTSSAPEPPDLRELLVGGRDVTGEWAWILDFLYYSVLNFEHRFGISDTIDSSEGGPGSMDLATFILQQEIVLERSPPFTLPLQSIMSKAPGIAIGTYVGLQAAGSEPLLMLITVPGGILAVSSAIGISKALERGLHKAVEKLF